MKLCFTSLHPAFFESLESRFERLDTAFVMVNHDSVLLIPIEPVGLLAKIKALGVLPAHLPLVMVWAFWYPFHRWAMQVLCVVTAQGG